MSKHIEAAVDFSQNAANCFDRAGGDVSNRFAEQLRRDGNENIQLALAAAAIAQAEAAERQAVAMERLAAMLESVISPIGGSPSISTFDAYQTWKESL